MQLMSFSLLMGGRLYGASAATFKFHQQMHLPAMANKYLCGQGRVLPTCWPCERKHKGPKRWINHVYKLGKNGLTYDASAFRDVSVGHLVVSQTRCMFLWEGLEEPTWPAPDRCKAVLEPIFGPSHTFLHAEAARISGYETIHLGDVVEGYNGSATFLGRVHNLFSVSNDAFYAILETWQCQESTPHFSKLLTVNSVLRIVRGFDITTACVFAERGNLVTVLRGGRNRRARGTAA